MASKPKSGRKTPIDPEKAAALAIRGRHLQEIRKRAGYAKQLHVVKKGVIDSGTLSTLENGLADMYCATAEKLADFYGVTVDVLLGREPIPETIGGLPRRAPVLASEEFMKAPPEVRERFVREIPIGGESWSTVRWSKALLDLISIHDTYGELPPDPTAPAEIPAAKRVQPKSER